MDNHDLRGECINILNNFEAIAINFTKGIADEQSLFTALAQPYCFFVRNNYAIICFYRKTKEDLFYTNTIDLYKVWSNRIIMKGLSLQSKGLKERLAEYSNKCYGETMFPKGTK